MWFILWLILSCFVLGIFVWSLQVLFQQKRGWQAFARKAGLVYTPGKMTESPRIQGRLKGYNVYLYTSAQQTNDLRGQRFVTVIEIEAGKGMPTSAAIATADYAPFIGTLKMDHALTPADPPWDESYVVRTRNAEKLKAYLTPERQKLLHAIFSTKNAIVLFFFDELDCVLRLETTDPLRNVDQMTKVMQRLLGAMSKLHVAPADAGEPSAPQEPAAPPVAQDEPQGGE